VAFATLRTFLADNAVIGFAAGRNRTGYWDTLFYAKQSQFMPFLAQKWTFVEKTKPNKPNSKPIQSQSPPPPKWR
jgi:hypothetical protein